MKINSFHLAGIRCFEDTGDIELSPACNLFVGQNNTGKSTLLKGLLGFQGFPFHTQGDWRPGSELVFHEMSVSGISANDALRIRPSGFTAGALQVVRNFKGRGPAGVSGIQQVVVGDDHGLFHNSRPSHLFVPFLARRKAPQLDHNITSGMQLQLNGTFSNLYSRIDLVATAGHPKHQAFQEAIEKIVGLPITTKASPSGKEAGFYLDEDNFVTLDRMGDGVTEMVALIVELCLEHDKVFVLEEPETNLHPKGLKALLSMIRTSAGRNQFIIATHSNIVVRELGSGDTTKVFRISRDDKDHKSPSIIEELPRTPMAHINLLRDLGYEFTDLGLFDAWLFLEESSAEEIIRDILIPKFAPALNGRLRTFSAGGVSNVEPRLAEFQRLVTFVHLQPIYEGRLWIRVDGDENGIEVAKQLRLRFTYLTDETCSIFQQPSFEHYYPAHFGTQITEVLRIADKQERRRAKSTLLREVLEWSKKNPAEADAAWSESASEPITMLRAIESSLKSRT